MKNNFTLAALLLLALSGAAQADAPFQECRFCDKRYENLGQLKLANADFTGTYLYGANLSWSVVKDGKFRSAVLSFARLEWSDFDGADFSKASLEDAAMSRSTFHDTDFRMANLSRANLARSDMAGAKFVTATLRDARLTDARLAGADMRQANLTGADLSGARLRDTDFQGAILKRADLQGCDLANANFNGAILDGATLRAVDIRQANFRSASMKGTDFRNAVLDAVNFQDADLSGADFTGAVLSNVLLQGAKICDTKLPDGSVFDCAQKAPGGGIEQRALLRGSARNENVVRVSVAGNAFSNFQKGLPAGIVAEAAAQVFKQMGRDAGFIAMPTDAALKTLETGRLDAATVVFKTPKIKDKYYFSDPVVTDYQVVVVRKGRSFDLQKRSDLYGKRLGGRLGYRYELVDRDPAINIQRYQSDGEMIRALLLDEVDGVLLAGISDVYALRSEGIMSQLETLKASVGTVPLMVAFAKSRFKQEDVEQFNAALKGLLEGAGWKDIVEHNGMGDLVQPLPPISE